MTKSRVATLLVGAGVALETATIYTYCLIGRLAPSFPAKASVLAIFLVLMTVLLGFLLSNSGARSFGWAILVLSLGFVAAIEFFAWTMFPGLRHGLVPLSGEHLARTVLGLVLSLSGLSGLALLAALIRRTTRRLRPSETDGRSRPGA